MSRPYTTLLALTLIRIPLALVLLAWLGLVQYQLATMLVAFSLMLIIELTDFLDGFIARRFSLTSEFGAMLDPYADSVARLLTYVALVIAGLALWFVPVVMAVRDVTVAYTRILNARSGRTAAAHVSGKLKAWVQGLGAFALLLGPLLWPDYAPGTRVWLSWLVAIATLTSAVEYVVKALRGVSFD